MTADCRLSPLQLSRAAVPPLPWPLRTVSGGLFLRARLPWTRFGAKEKKAKGTRQTGAGACTTGESTTTYRALLRGGIHGARAFENIYHGSWVETNTREAGAGVVGGSTCLYSGENRHVVGRIGIQSPRASTQSVASPLLLEEKGL